MKKYQFLLLSACLLSSLLACKSTKQTAATVNTGNSSSSVSSAKAGIILKTGQVITVTSSSSSNSELAMGMEMTNTTASTNILKVIGADEKNYQVSNTLSKFAVSIKMMGQDQSYDSEKPEDKDNEMGKEISNKLNIPDTSFLDRLTGAVIAKNNNKNPEETENPFAGLMSAMGGNDKDAVMESAFFILPADKKAGDTWKDSTVTGKIKTVKTYTLQSISGNVATLEFKSVGTGSGEMEMQGNEAAFTMDTNATGTMLVDIKTSLVNKVTTDTNMNMNLDVMGQSMPITSKVNSTVTYQY